MAGKRDLLRVFDVHRLRIDRGDADGTGDVTLFYNGKPLAVFPDERSCDKDDGTFSGLAETTLIERAQIIALAQGMIDEISPAPLYASEWHVAPDRRLILELRVGFDSRDIHQQRSQFSPRVYNAQTGVKLLDLLRIECDWRFAWDADGALRLTSDDVSVRIAIAEGTFAHGADGWQPHPIQEAQSTLLRLLVARPDDDGLDGRVRRITLLDRLFWPAVAGVVVLAVAAIWAGALPKLGRTIAGGGSVDSWLVQCPGSALPILLHRTPQNRLDVPHEFAPAPLEAMQGRANRYSNGTVVVEIGGSSAKIWTRGLHGKAIECRNPAAQ